MSDAEGVFRFGEGAGAGIACGAVRKDALDAHPVGGEGSSCVQEEAGLRLPAFIGKDANDSHPRSVVDADVDIVVSVPPPLLGLGAASEHAVTTAVRYAGQLLDVDMNELACMVAHVPHRDR